MVPVLSLADGRLQSGGHQSRDQSPPQHPCLQDLWALPSFRAAGRSLAELSWQSLPLPPGGQPENRVLPSVASAETFSLTQIPWKSTKKAAGTSGPAAPCLVQLGLAQGSSSGLLP